MLFVVLAFTFLSLSDINNSKGRQIVAFTFDAGHQLVFDCPYFTLISQPYTVVLKLVSFNLHIRYFDPVQVSSLGGGPIHHHGCSFGLATISQLP